jgi:hypothetical protein
VAVIARLKVWAAGLGVLVAMLAASWFGGRKAAQTAAKLESAERRLYDAIRAKEIENDVATLRPDALRERARKWVRKGD